MLAATLALQRGFKPTRKQRVSNDHFEKRLETHKTRTTAHNQDDNCRPHLPQHLQRLALLSP